MIKYSFGHIKLVHKIEWLRMASTEEEYLLLKSVAKCGNHFGYYGIIDDRYASVHTFTHSDPHIAGIPLRVIKISDYNLYGKEMDQFLTTPGFKLPRKYVDYDPVTDRSVLKSISDLESKVKKLLSEDSDLTIDVLSYILKANEKL